MATRQPGEADLSTPVPTGRSTAPSAERRPSLRPNWLDPILASDPALTRLVSALATTLSMGLCFLVEWQFVNATGALEASGPQSTNSLANVSTLHHEAVIVAMLVGGVLALMLGLSFDESDFKGAAAATILPTIPLLLATVLTLALGSQKWLVLVLNPLLLGIGTLFRRFGSRGSNVGTMLYMGGFFGYFLSAQFGIKAFGWIALEVLVACLVIYMIRIPLLLYQRKSNLERAMRSYSVRARLLTRNATEVLLGKSGKSSNRLNHGLVRLNEMALIIEAYISKIKDGELSEEMRQTLFDLELSLSNLARFSDTLSKLNLPSIVSRDIVDYILMIPASGTGRLETEMNDCLARWQTFAPTHDAVMPTILRRLATSIVNLNVAAIRWREIGHAVKLAQTQPESSMPHVASLRTGHLPGSAEVSAAASSEPWDNGASPSIGLTPEVRAAIQITVATTAATWIGYFVDPQRYYWAPLSALLCFMGVHNAGEQVRKGLYRFLGTVIGVFLGSVIARMLGLNPAWDSIAVLGAMFLGSYLSRINYTFLAMGVTVAISMVFLQLSELTSALLAERVLETAVGALVASLTALFVLPLGPRRVIATARTRYLDTLRKVLESGAAYLSDSERETEVVGWSREADSAFHALIATVKPLQWSLLGGLNLEVNELISRASAVRNYSRTFLADLREPRILPPRFPEALASVVNRFDYSISCLARPNVANTAPYVRVSSFVESTKADLGLEVTPLEMGKADLLMRDLILLDGSLAALAKALGVPVTSLDTAKVPGTLIS